MILYLAYGSNMNLEQMKYRCPNSKVVGKGVLHGWKLVFNTHADIIEDEGSTVPVLLWKISDSDWESLDRYEGYPKYYTKVIVTPIMNGKKVRAIAYVMTSERKGILPPFEGYFRTIEKGYEENDIPFDALYKALDESWEYYDKQIGDDNYEESSEYND